jgi:hypothetical protein
VNAVLQPVLCAFVNWHDIIFSTSSTPSLTPITSGDAVQNLIESSVNFWKFGRVGLGAEVDLIKGAQCYSLPIDNLDETVDLVEEQVSQ